jgi:CRP-like cAMP-binding protein
VRARGEAVVDTAETARALTAVELFAGLSPEVIAAMVARTEERAARKGEVIVEQGAEGDALLVLTAGSLAVVRVSPVGDRMVLNVLRPPDALGELALLDGEPRSVSIEALEPSRLLALPRTAFLELVHAEPALMVPLLRTMAKMLRRLTDQTSDYVFLDLAGRLAKVLVQLGDKVRPGRQTVVIEVTQGRLAEMVGGSRQSVNQALSSFAQRGLVEVEGRSVRLLDRAALRRRAKLPDPEPPHGVPGPPPR